MTAPPISASLIVRNGARTLEKCIASLRPHVDEVCVQVADGSTDGTLDLLDDLAGQPGAPIRVEEVEWCSHYADARERAAAMCSHDWIVSIDADEVLVGGEALRPTLDLAVSLGKTCLVLAFDAYEIGDDHMVAPRISVFRRDAGRWRGYTFGRWLPDDPHTQGWMMTPLGSAETQIAEPWIYHLSREFWGDRPEAGLLAALGDSETPQAALALAEIRTFQDRWPEAEALAKGYLARPFPDPYYGGHLTALEIVGRAREKAGDQAGLHAAHARYVEAVQEYLRLPSLAPLFAQAAVA